MKKINCKGRVSRTARRAAAFFLAAALVLGLAPMTAPEARAAHWADEYMNTLVEWGVMRDDQEGNMDGDREITRAELVTMINRAYGYQKMGPIPFEDVKETDWFFDDVSIAYTMGYFKGTSEDGTTADPLGPVTKEQAAVFMGRNMMLEEGVGEALSFSDTRDFAEWSRDLIDAVADRGIITGVDGSYYPKNNIKRGEMAAILVRAIGTPIREEGDYSLDSVYGNVTISSSGVTLRDTVIGGDLYLTGGVGLGDVQLENVTVLGRIVVAGAGESAKGDSSVILRNVLADEMLVDSLGNQYVTIRAEGDTSIGTTNVRTHGFLEDATTSGLGLELIKLDGESGISLDLAGDIKEVINMSPDSLLRIAQGVAQMVTIDEEATNALLSIENGARVKELNLDVATTVTGLGDLAHVNVNAPGSTVSMLPDSIEIRPGITADIAGETMDTVAAAESSEDPRLLNGYPAVRNVAPDSATAVFSTNKRGTIYWALTALTDGSADEEELMSPAAYGSPIISSGTLTIGASNTETSVTLADLISDGSYYLSAMLVDNRGQRSSVKVAAFTTPDDLKPDFANGYPYMSKITHNSAQVSVMPNKSCLLYYALLPEGSVEPTPQEFKTGAVTGNLGYGSMDVKKNTPISFDVNSRLLAEQTTYDLYLWLIDHNGAQSSDVEKLTFTTIDGTPPIIISGPTLTKQQERSVSFDVTVNEDGTFYWAVVKTGEEYPKPLAGQSGEIKLESENAKLQVAAGIGALTSGRQGVRANQVLNFTINGLEPETSYDLYYLAQDKAGNYSAQVQKLTFNTLDGNAPTATIEFTDYNESDPTRPLASTDVIIRFSERVQTHPDGVLLDELYANVTQSSVNSPGQIAAREELAAVLKEIFTFYDLTGGDEKEAKIRPDDGNDDWVIDYRYAQVTVENGCTVITFPTDERDMNRSSLNLKSGSTYRFDIKGLADASRNIMPSIQLPDAKGFTTVFAQINLRAVDAAEITKYIKYGSNTEVVENVGAHLGFTMQPVSTSKVDDSIKWDMIIWTDDTMEFQLYRRKLNTDGDEEEGWEELGPSAYRVIVGYDSEMQGASVVTNFEQRGQTRITFPDLCDLDDTDAIYEYAIKIESIGPLPDEAEWNTTVNMMVSVVAGGNIDLGNFAANLTRENWQSQVKAPGAPLTSIGNVVATGTDELTLTRTFDDKRAPVFYDDTPLFQDIDDSSATMVLKLNRAGTIYYEIAPAEVVRPTGTITDGNGTRPLAWAELPGNGLGTINSSGTAMSDPILQTSISLTVPTVEQITSRRDASNERVICDTVEGDTTATNIPLTDLEANTEYVAYFVMKGTANVYSDRVYVYGFKTEEVIRPVIELTLNNPSVGITTDRNAIVEGLLVTEDMSFLRNTVLNTPMSGNLNTTNATVTALFATGGVYEGFTYLDAMMEDVRQNNKSIGSVFDLYASQGAKDAVANYIRSQVSDTTNITYKMNATEIRAGATIWEDCDDYMSSTGTYVFLAVGRNAQGTSGDAFRAIYPLFRRDFEKPMVTYVGGMLSQGASGKYHGNLLITFSEPIYERRSASGSLADKWAVVVLKVGDVAATGEVSIDTRLKVSGLGSVDINYDDKTNYGPMEVLSMKVSNFSIGDTIYINSTSLCDTQSNTNSSQLILTLVANEDGKTAHFEINEPWDATGAATGG